MTVTTSGSNDSWRQQQQQQNNQSTQEPAQEQSTRRRSNPLVRPSWQRISNGNAVALPSTCAAGPHALSTSSSADGVVTTLVTATPTGGGGGGGQERETWTSKTDFLMSVIGFAVDLANVWRFPYLCFKNGGGAFLIPYALMVFLAGVPLFFMELSLGQYYRKGAITTWGRICPLFKGIGYCVVIIAFYTDFFYNVVIAWSVHFLVASFTPSLSWASCNNSYNSRLCYEPSTWSSDSAECVRPAIDANGSIVQEMRVSAAEEYFYKGFLGLQEPGAASSAVVRGVDDLGRISPSIAICLGVVYLICYFSMYKGIQMSGKVVWFTALFPYVVLSAMMVRGISLPGAATGIEYYLRPNLSMLSKAEVWQDAASQVFFSLGPGFGVLLAYASYNDFKNNVYMDALVASSINCLTSFLSGFVIFAVLGYMSCKSGRPIETVAAEGPGLVFVVYPEALATMPFASVWSVLFFLMLITLGLDSSFGGSEAIITALSDEWPWIRRNRKAFIAILFSFYMIVGLAICTEGGILVMEWLIVYGTAWGLLIAVLTETIVISLFYGVDQLAADLEEMMGFSPGLYWRFCWRVAAPVFLLLMIVNGMWNYSPLTYQDYSFPEWATRLGLLFAFSAAAAIPIVGFLQFIRAPGRTLKEKFRSVMTPYRALPHQREYTPLGRPSVRLIHPTLQDVIL